MKYWRKQKRVYFKAILCLIYNYCHRNLGRYFTLAGHKLPFKVWRSQVSSNAFPANMLLTSIIQAFSQKAVIVWRTKNKLNSVLHKKILPGTQNYTTRSYLCLMYFWCNLWAVPSKLKWYWVLILKEAAKTIHFFHGDASFLCIFRVLDIINKKTHTEHRGSLITYFPWVTTPTNVN